MADADEVLSHWDAIRSRRKTKGASVSDASVLAGVRSHYRHYCGRMRCRSGRVVRGLIGCERGMCWINYRGVGGGARCCGSR